MRFLCRIGLHDWNFLKNFSEDGSFQAKRCRCCGKVKWVKTV